MTLTLASAVAPDAAAQTPPATAPSGKRHTAADVQFMRGMIAHHAQAIVMAAMAPTHGASAHVGLFGKKVMVSQRDEIELMQDWLKDHGEAVPDSNDAMSHHAMHKDMSASEHATLMPGMLTTAQLAQLGQARDTTFDRLFLTFMIQHHEGALAMVARLFDTPGAGQSPEIFGFATGVDADQRAEIARMQGMLTTITGRTAK
ncbi:MAG TPA: DUF305 domain-containing protein [Gemmatimonadaceae bacterium]|nr:DUF305 domain-containing protein [Gemmatimonadaceae bacterium]